VDYILKDVDGPRNGKNMGASQLHELVEKREASPGTLYQCTSNEGIQYKIFIPELVPSIVSRTKSGLAIYLTTISGLQTKTKLDAQLDIQKVVR